MNLGDIGSGCPDCGAALHEGMPCPPSLDRDPAYREPPMPKWLKAVIIAAAVGGLVSVIALIAQLDWAERDRWRAENMRRTELCEERGGIPRYQVRGRSYDGCDFPPQERSR
jgi:hypothetical protein